MKPDPTSGKTEEQSFLGNTIDTKNRTLFSILAVPLLACLFVVITCGLPGNRKIPPVAKAGLLDLREWDFEKDGIVSLKGEWEFYWQEFLSPDEIADTAVRDKKRFVSVPASWTVYTANKEENRRFPSGGYATYRLKVLLPGGDVPLGFKLNEVSTAYRFFCNGKELIKNGTVGKNPESSVPYRLPVLGDLFTCPKEMDLVMHISNFHHREGGFIRELKLGTQQQIRRKTKTENSFEMFLFGSLIFMSLYHIVLYMYRKKDKSALFIGLLCLIVALRTGLTGERLFVYFFRPGYRFYNILEYMTAYFGIPVFLLFIHSLFPREINLKIVMGVLILGFIYSFLLIPVSQKTSSYIILSHNIIQIVMVLYVIFALIKALIKQRESVFFLLIGFLILGFTVINDILYFNSLITTVELIPLGLFLFNFSQSIVIAKRFSKSFQNSEDLTIELEKKNQDLSQLDKLKDEFLANTSHELKTPINGIIGLAESLVEGAAGTLSKKITYNLWMIISSGKRLANLINDILDLSRYKQGELFIQKKPVDIKVTSTIVFDLVKPLIQGKSIELINAVENTTPPVLGDESRLQQILLNLTSNAIKFTDKGKVTVSAAHDTSMVTITVSDTGIGIPRDKLETIFESFEQVDASISRDYGGTGLGLSITRKLIELHGGTIRVESEVGKGSNFILTLPVCMEKKVPEEKKIHLLSRLYENNAAQRQNDLTGQFTYDEYTADSGAETTVLIVDDEPVNRQVLYNHLAIKKYRVIQAEDGIRALELIESGLVPDIMLLDIMMPRLSGYEVCRKIREQYDRIALPVILLTAKNQVQDLVEGFCSGANDYISKPIFKDELLSRIETILELKKKTESLVDLNKTLEEKVSTRTEALEDANTKIVTSINYAQKIQKATLPDPASLGEIFNSYFLIWKPCQIVGGDFYWLYQTEHQVLFALNDCTGHGVPGAFMAMIGNAVLNHIASDICHDDPARILSEANKLIKTFLKQDRKASVTDDGMDAGICYIDRKEGKLVYAGARISLYYSRDGRVYQIKGNKQSLGYQGSKSTFHYQNHEISLRDETTFYLTTDGFITQTGDKEKEQMTFGSRRLMEILENNLDLSLYEQNKILEKELYEFMGEETQIDDITFIGFTVKKDEAL